MAEKQREIEPGDLVTHTDNKGRIGIVTRIDPDWMKAWSNAWVLWQGESCVTQHTIRTLEPLILTPT